MDLENLKITFVEGQEEPKHCNTYRLGYSETEITLDFGNVLENEKKIEGIEIVTRIAMPVEALRNLLMSLFLIGREYEEKYQRDIGMSLEGESREEDG